MKFELKEYPDKTWSISKMNIFNSCQRKYYYTYYASHNGWNFNAPSRTKAIWRLKKMTNIALLKGDKIHEIIREIIKNNENFCVNVVIQNLFNSLNNVIKDSILKTKTGDWDDYPRGEMLEEYYFGCKIDPDIIQYIKEQIITCINNFKSSYTYNYLINNKCDIIENDNKDFNSFLIINGCKVYCLLDLLYIDKNGNYIIVDWKTESESSKNILQLKAYCIYIMNKYNVPINKIKYRIEYLNSNIKYDYQCSLQDIEEIKEVINNNIKETDQLLIDINKNIPKQEKFFMTTKDNQNCVKCKYKKICFATQNQK